MNASIIISLVLSAIGGAIIGGFYFGVMWLTVRRLPQARRPAVFILGGFIVRLVVALVGLYLIMGGRWERAAAALVGFVLVRAVLTRVWGPGGLNPNGNRNPRVDAGGGR